MLRRIATSLLITLLALVIAVPAFAAPGKPNFVPALWADGRAWGTKAAAIIPAPTSANMHSFDKLFIITNSNNPNGQMPVAEAAPGNPAYNGGRWYAQTVMWTEAGFASHGEVPVLKSYQELMVHYQSGHLTIMPGSPEGGPPPFFECPLLPVK